MREDPGQRVQEAVQGGPQEGDQGRDQGPGWGHHRPGVTTLTVSTHTLNRADVNTVLDEEVQPQTQTLIKLVN